MKLLIDSDMAQLPHNCHECVLCYGGWCAVMPSEQDEMCPDSDKPTWCPMSEYKEPTKFDIKHAISNIDKPVDLDDEQFFAVMANIYYAMAKLYGEEIPTYNPSGRDKP